MIIALALVASALAQLPEFEEFRAAKSPVAAAEVAVRLDRVVHDRYIQAMKAAASGYPDQVMRWLPENFDGFWVSREPFQIDPEFFLNPMGPRSSIAYAADHLMSLDEGRFGGHFHGRWLRMIAGGQRGSNAVHFYFFDGSIDRSVMTAGELSGNWMALPEPDLLVVANNREFLDEILLRIEKKQQTKQPMRAELQYVRRDVSFWGFHDRVAVSFDETSREIEMHFLKPVGKDLRYDLTAYKRDEPAAGVTRWSSDVKRGPGPLQPAMQQLGFPLHPAAYQFVGTQTTPRLKTQASVTEIVQDLNAALRTENWRRASELTPQLIAAASAQRQQVTGKETAAWNERILRWLPEDVESVIAAGTSSTLGDPHDDAIVARALPLMMLASAEDGAVLKQFSGKTLIAAVVAGRKFSDPPRVEGERPDLGLQPFRGCGVYIFAEGLASAEVLLKRPAEDVVLRLPIWTAKSKQPGHRGTFVSFPKPDTLVACNDRDFLRDLIERAMAVPEPERVALPASLSQWKHVDMNAPAWGVSRYGSRAYAAALLTSEPVRPTGAAMVLNGTVARLRIFSTANPWKQATSEPPLRDFSTITEIAPGVWELKVEGDSAALGMVPLLALSLMQFQVFI